MEIITLETQAFYALVNKLVAEIKAQHVIEDKWVDGIEAMRLLRITSKTTLQKLRDTGAIRFSQPEKKIILYDRTSILAYIDKFAKSTF